MFKKLCVLSFLVTTAAYSMDSNMVLLRVRYAALGDKTCVIPVDATSTVADVKKICRENGYTKSNVELVLTTLVKGELNQLYMSHIKVLSNDENMKSLMSVHATHTADLGFCDEDGDIKLLFDHPQQPNTLV